MNGKIYMDRGGVIKTGEMKRTINPQIRVSTTSLINRKLTLERLVDLIN